MAWRKKTSRPLQGSNPCKVFVGNISYRIKERELSEFFSGFGPVAHCQVVKDHQKGWSRGIGFVTFKTVEAADLVLHAPDDELILDGRVMRVSTPETKKRLRAQQEAQGVAGSSSIAGSSSTAGSSNTAGSSSTAGSSNTAGEDSVGDRDEGCSDNLVHKVSKDTLVENSIPELNDDILLHVFSYLGLKDRIRVERVCKRWLRVARLSWQTEKRLSFRNVFSSFRGKYGGLSNDILHSVLKRGCRDLQLLDLSGSPHFLTDYGLDLIGMYCSKLVSLDLSGVSVTQSSFKLLTQRCSGLKWLKMSGCHQVGEKCLWWALHNCKDLEYLNVANNRRINGQCFFMSGEKLKTVVLKECDKATDAAVTFLVKHSHHLEELDISHCPQLTGTSIRNIAENCLDLKELYFAGPNQDVKTSDMMKLGSLERMEVLVVDSQIAFGDEVLFAIGRNCLNLRRLSCEACYNILDGGFQCLAVCFQLTDLTTSYCHQVTDIGLMSLAQMGVLERLIARGCQGISDAALCCLAEKCTRLQELDICGCLRITNKTLYAFQESLLHMREPGKKQFTLVVGGTNIDGELAMQFAAATGAVISLHDLSIYSLSADYDPFMDIPSLTWDDDNEPATEIHPGGLLEAEVALGFAGGRDFLKERAEDFLVADDPALYSDEFSDPEDWGFS